MSRNTTSQNISPTVRIQKSSPQPQQEQSQSMIAQQSPWMGSEWNSHQGSFLNLPNRFHSQVIHKRGSSGSSVASAGGPPSPLSHNTLYPHIATENSNFSPYNLEEFSTPHTAKSLTSHDMSGLFNQANGYGSADMRRIQSSGPDDRASYSVSTMSHNSPATPHTNYENDFEDQKYLGREEPEEEMSRYLQFAGEYPSAAYQQPQQDVFSNQHFQYQQPAIQQIQPNHRQMISDRLQAANSHLRTNSPTSNPRDKSPFRQNSPYSTKISVRQQSQPNPAQLHRQRTSVSPKELMLDESDLNEQSPTPLFQDQAQPQQVYQRRNQSNMSNFYVPTFGNEPTVQVPQHYPFVSQQSQSASQSGMPESTPDFPAHMISMESTNEEGPSMPSSQQSSHETRTQARPTPQRPADTTSGSGTYSCTYRGCPDRFDSQAKLQKHKRDGHRQTSPSHNAGSASPSVANRNSQAGPHRCDRTNPSTGKPCASIFSRPYDLTRHEDTIHNSRKIKVRCHLCTEEKTFSRNDALTRHMRVVHPDIDWVGKQKRKSHKS